METVKNCICSICTNRCIMDVTVEDGKLLRAKAKRAPGYEGCSHACIRGTAAADYVYRPDRVLTPLRRVGRRGEGKFEPICWDEAYRVIAEKLLALRETYGADSVAFFSGYSKWYRPMLHRLAFSFGSVNFGTESSTCHHAAVLAEMCDTGLASAPDYDNAGVLLTFGRYHLPKPAREAHKRGMKIVAVDPTASPDLRDCADLLLRPRPGTDAALAGAVANLLIENGKTDPDFLEKHVHGFDAYREYVARFTPETAEELTGVPAADIRAAADMIGENLPLSIHHALSGAANHRNGVQLYRAWNALNAVTGCYGKPGGNQPGSRLQPDATPPVSFREFAFSTPRELPKDNFIGGRRFPVWAEKINECQCVDFPAAIARGELRAIFALGLNVRMFPGSKDLFEALKQLDFYVDCDLWLSDSAKYADIVLPVATTYEHDMIARVGNNNKLWFSRHVIEPLGQARSDDDILCELARAMDLDDDLLKAGKEACWRWQLEGTGITLEQLMAGCEPYTMPPAEPRPDPLNEGFPTPSGKFELSSELLKKHGFFPLPEFIAPLEDQDLQAYPLTLMTGIRTDHYAYAIHSRTHTVPALRRLRPEAAVDIHPADAAALGVQKGDRVLLETAFGSIEVGVDLDSDLLPGTVNMFHGYSECDVNTLLPGNYLDPISGFPGFKCIACRIVKK